MHIFLIKHRSISCGYLEIWKQDFVQHLQNLQKTKEPRGNHVCSSEASQKMQIFFRKQSYHWSTKKNNPQSHKRTKNPTNQNSKKPTKKHSDIHTQKTNMQLQHSFRRSYSIIANTAIQDSVLVSTVPSQAQALVTNTPEVCLFNLPYLNQSFYPIDLIQQSNHQGVTIPFKKRTD